VKTASFVDQDKLAGLNCKPGMTVALTGSNNGPIEEEKMKNSVLFVDDEQNVLKSLKRALFDEPFEQYYALGPEEAFRILAENEIDLVVSDHIMPEMEGLTFLKHVMDLKPEVVRVILTGQADLQLAMQAINEGEVFRFLTKPWNDLELKITLRQILEFIDLRKEKQVLMSTVKRQKALLDDLESEHPGILKVSRDDSGCIVLEEEPAELEKYFD
jgi:two-component system, probable response regulator PhcQ